MLGRWCLGLTWAWLAAQAATAYFCLAERSGLARDLWFASAAALFPLLAKLSRFAVAAPKVNRKMLSVQREMIVQMAVRTGLTLTLAAALYWLAEVGLTDRFWIGLAGFYQVALALETGLLLHDWNSSPAATPGGPA